MNNKCIYASLPGNEGREKTPKRLRPVTIPKGAKERMPYQNKKELDSLVMAYSGVIAYLSDIEDYRLYYLSRAGMELCGLTREEEYRNKPCHQVLFGRDTPCPHCTNRLLTRGEPYRWEQYFRPVDRWYECVDHLVEVGGRPCHLEVSVDVTERRRQLGELTRRLEEEEVLVRCLNVLTRQQELGRAIEQFLCEVCGFYQADRAYIFEFDHDRRLMDNTFEWCAKGVTPQIDQLKEVTLAAVEPWLEAFESFGGYAIHSVERDLDPDSEGARILKEQGIHCVMAAPLWRGNHIVGCVGVDNPGSYVGDITLLRTTAGFVIEELEKRRLMEEMERMSSVDALTGLFSRNQYIRVLRGYETEPPRTLGVVSLDINGLKEINDRYGFEFGDRVLRRAAELLRKFFTRHVYRIGGDEFVVLCADSTREEFQDKTVALRDAFERDDLCDVSIGFAWSYDNEEIDATALRLQAHEMRRADKQSHYHAALGENREMTHTGLVGELLREIEEGRFVVYYQPQVDLKTGAVVGAEALVRKFSEDGSMIPPGRFISFYEMSGVISHVDLFVLGTACKALRRWWDEGYRLRVSVNFSRVTLLEPNIVEVITGICAAHGVPPEAITIEVTESIGKMDSDLLRDLVCRLKTAGFSVSLDDFGSQYSNLAILAAMDFDEVKFDRSLVSTLEENDKSKVVMESGLGLCRALSGTVSLAEGIETAGQLELLNRYQCEYGQGYYFSRPVGQEEFEAYMAEHRG